MGVGVLIPELTQILKIIIARSILSCENSPLDIQKQFLKNTFVGYSILLARSM